MEGTSCIYTYKLLQMAEMGVLQYGWPALKKACHEMLCKASDLNGHFWNDHNKEIVRIGPLNVRNW